jgi:hypothetical protein
MTVQSQGIRIPVLFIVFKRADTAQRVFEAIRQARPPRLYVAADGPRPGKEGEAEQTQATRDIVRQVDWECEVKTLFRDQNLGCGVGPATAIDWFFENEEAGIILEDDCLPNQSFFVFCQEIIEKYAADTRIMQVSGVNPQQDWRRDPDYDYYFSEAGITWGWATWRRAWKLYDYTIPHFKEAADKGYLDNFYIVRERVDWVMNCLEEAYRREPYVSWWDFQWEFAKFANSGLSVVPNVNLVTNIGFGADATHTFEDVDFATAASTEMEFPVRHPPFMIRDTQSDKRYHASQKSVADKIKQRIKRLMPQALWRKIKR